MTRPRIIVLGMLTKMPVAGVIWQNMHYLLGFERLGYEAWYVEANGINPSMFCADGDLGSARAAAFLARTMAHFGLADQWAYHALHDDGAVYGLTTGELRDLYRSAEVVINLHGGTIPREEHTTGGPLVYLETDPCQLQAELAAGLPETHAFLEPHAKLFSFGERYGLPGCGLPVSDRFTFLPTRQPVVVDLWADAGTQGANYTTIGNWRQRWRDVTIDGEPYTWSKHHEFARVMDLPARTGAPFELALAAYRPSDREVLEQAGWQVRDAEDVSADADTYRRYIGGSRGEFTVAKDQNVRLRTGWFSDRSATYLAAGRPVITQDTGFGDLFPVGEGLFAFSTVDEAAAAVAEVEGDPARHAKAAGAIAREHFEAVTVLRRLLDEVHR
jgi:hypothetical protein